MVVAKPRVKPEIESAWREYLDTTRGQRDYESVEAWAWARLWKRLADAGVKAAQGQPR